MRLTTMSLLAALALPLALPDGAIAAPTQEQVYAARQAFIGGDYAAALPVLREAAEAGNGMALNILGAAYDEGRGVPQDAGRALALFERAAAAGEIRARYNLGMMFAFGTDAIRIDIARAKSELQIAADTGYAPAMTALGGIEERADPPDHTAAADWYEKAHQAGDRVATANLANAYVQGRGRAENWFRARVLYTEAAARGLPRAFNDLGVMHEQGYGVHADSLTAFTYFLQAVSMDYARAGVNMAELTVQARFPFMTKERALGYCLWALDAAPETERPGFEVKCDAVDKALEADDTMRAKAKAFAERL